ncbi:SurA N-terminal domain-containing protein [Campylobacter sp. JMF_04 NA10]|uniref:SurA N-terminal domain-containing protein n=1 Tax=Campylobacter sp. JMF_04 NA10 TaxID=2983824 RepID=UPI0022E99D36|nr:SurA N-terminal domain-containing protein [Campylobacter sp. JMF_04 NA10]MDA3076171.1 SurA N-terminal domain-containing protein [Campylobacter sp. JMF_04 NA10]
MIKKLAVVALLGFGALNANVVNSVVAVVENEPITNYELARVQKATGASPQAAMEILIKQKLQDSEIKRRGITVSPAEIDNRIKMIAEQNKLSLEQLQKALKQQKMSEEAFRENVRRGILEEKLYGPLFADVQRTVTPQNVRRFYEQNPSLFTTFDSITLTRYIAKTESALNPIKRNPNARPGNVYVMRGTLKSSQMDAGLKYIVTSVDKGKFSPVIPTANGYEMFYVNDKKGVQTADFESVQEKAIEAYVTNKRKKMVEEFNDRIRANANVRIIDRNLNPTNSTKKSK